MTKKTYKFSVRKIIDSYYEVEAEDENGAFEELQSIIDQEDTLNFMDEDNADVIVGADARLIVPKKSNDWVHINGMQVSDLQLPNRSI